MLLERSHSGMLRKPASMSAFHAAPNANSRTALFGAPECGMRSTRTRNLALVATVLFALASGVRAAPPLAWRAQAWHVEDGLPDNRVVGLAQTPDGYLCVATREGLVRFNGAGFEGFTFANPSGVAGNGVRAMFSDAAGDLWLDMFRETIVRIRRDSVQVFTSREGVPPGEMTSLAEDAEGHVWLVIGGRTCELEGGRLRQLDLPPASLASDVRGRVWCAVNKQVGLLSRAGFAPRFQIGEGPVALARAQAGGLWICAGSRLLRLADEGEPESRQTLAPGIRARCLLEDRSGAVWIGSAANGLLRFDGKAVAQVESSYPSVTCLLEDRESNIWVGTAGGGLNRLRPRVIELVGPKSGSVFESLASVGEDANGQLWVVTSNGQLAHGDGESWTFEQWAGGNATCVAADQQGAIWVGTRGQGLHQKNLRSGATQIWRQQNGLPSSSIRGLFVAADESVWIATTEPAGLCQVTKNDVRKIEVPGDVRTFRAITQDGRGDIWVGTSEGRILKIKEDRLVSEPILNDPTQSAVRSLHTTPDGSLWIGYAGRGVGWLKDGRFTLFSTNTGLVDNSIWQIVSDRTGAIWMTGPHGLSRVANDDARAVAEGEQTKLRPTLFGRGEGLASFVANYASAPAVCRTRDGRILFATSQGLLVVDPANLRDNPLPPPVILERVIVDDRVVALTNRWFPLRPDQPRPLVEIQNAGAVLRLPPDHRRLAFDFVALSYAAPENIRFRYRLDSVDDAWTETGSERTARYPRLAAGNYTFRVVACNDMGVWNERGATLALIVSPFFWQTWWFRLGLFATFTGSVVTVVRLVSFRRLRQKLQVAEQQAALSQERARIARDIHDDLGGSLSHIKLLSELALQDRTPPDPTEGSLRQITATARQMLKSLDEIVWAINPRNDTLPHLISYLGQHTVEFLRAAGVRCQIELPDDPPEMEVASDVRHHVFLVLKEALTNIVRHAQARTVRIEIRCALDSLQISLDDDGCGFAPPAGDSQGDGLRNMRRRMAAVGGEFALESKPGTGTRLQLKVTLRR